jgi:succinoglycan biosynthesis protein ExoA
VAENLPSITILIPARPEQSEVKAVSASRLLDYPADKLEIIIARGKHPSVQRNTGLRQASGELIYFLDDDSIPQVKSLHRAVVHFSNPQVKMLGGPNICPPDAPALEKTFAVVLGSLLAFGPSRARYTPVGQRRATNEKELILCNLMARREDVLKLGGFNEALYPNEENALMDQLQADGGLLLYDPEFFVFRRPRPTLSAFIRMLRTYGRGRAEQFKVHPTPGSALNFVPPLFLIYLILLVPALVIWPQADKFLLIPLALYCFALLVQGAALMPKAGIGRTLGAIPLIILTHLLYGYGFWKGLFTPLQHSVKTSTEVKLEVISR